MGPFYEAWFIIDDISLCGPIRIDKWLVTKIVESINRLINKGPISYLIIYMYNVIFIVFIPLKFTCQFLQHSFSCISGLVDALSIKCLKL